MVKDIPNNSSLTIGAFIQNKLSIPYRPFLATTHIFLTQKGNSSLRQEILKLIIDARNVLKICSFIITDKQIYELLLDKAKERKVAIFILTQLDQTKLTNRSLLEDFLTEEEIEDSSSQNHLNCIKNLFDQGVHVRASTTAHAKFIISDRNIGFITSANMTTPSLGLNTESGVYLRDNDAIELDKLFDIVFQKGTKYRQYITASKRKTFVVQGENKVDTNLLPAPNATQLRYTYEDANSNLYEEIIQITNASNEYLFLSAYSIVGLESLPELVDALRSAKQRGVSIDIFCRGMNYRNDHLRGSDIIANIGCNIYADVYNHSKGIINENTGMLFTANIDGNHGLKNGFEVGYILDDRQRLEFLHFHKHLIESSTYRYELKPTRLDFFETYKAYEREKGIKPPSTPSEITITIKGGLRINQEEFASMPIFYSRIQGASCTLFVARKSYQTTYSEGNFELLEVSNANYKAERYLLKYDNLKIIHN
jgi:phosphatidylserine/phosphatidylglycerophosphate/cardiolipin synthase-like enzyme